MVSLTSNWCRQGLKDRQQCQRDYGGRAGLVACADDRGLVMLAADVDTLLLRRAWGSADERTHRCHLDFIDRVPLTAST